MHIVGVERRSNSIVPQRLDQRSTARFIMHPFVRVRAVV